MRTEALLYFAVAGLVTCVVRLSRRRRLSDPVGRGIAMLGGLAVPLVLEQLLEEVTLGGSLRAGRAGSTADAVGSGLGTRIREAFMTTLGLNRFPLTMDIVVGALIVALVVFGVWRLARDDGKEPLLGVALVAVACMFMVLRFTDGLGFVSGLLTASPLAAVGLVLGWRRRTSLPVLVGALALPLVWAFQYSGGAGPQWGGRYELLSGALFAVVGIVVLEGKRVALVAAVTAAALVTAFGLAWLSQRSNTVAEGMEAIVARHDQAVVSLEAHALREGGAFYDPTRRWLTGTTSTKLRRGSRSSDATA